MLQVCGEEMDKGQVHLVHHGRSQQQDAATRGSIGGWYGVIGGEEEVYKRLAITADCWKGSCAGFAGEVGYEGMKE